LRSAASPGFRGVGRPALAIVASSYRCHSRPAPDPPKAMACCSGPSLSHRKGEGDDIDHRPAHHAPVLETRLVDGADIEFNHAVVTLVALDGFEQPFHRLPGPLEYLAYPLALHGENPGNGMPFVEIRGLFGDPVDVGVGYVGPKSG